MIEYKVGDRDTRPWGKYEVTAVGRTDGGEEFCEKIITVHAGQILSLQSHKLRREYWEVKSGTLTVIADGKRFNLRARESISHELGVIHAMANLSAAPCVVFERQEGICREEDIIRYLDAYGRGVDESADPRVVASLVVYRAIMNEIKVAS